MEASIRGQRDPRRAHPELFVPLAFLLGCGILEVKDKCVFVMCPAPFIMLSTIEVKGNLILNS